MARSRASKRSLIAGSIMFAPYLILLALFGVWPIIQAGLVSLEPTVLNPSGGVQNFADVVADVRFLPAALNVVVFLAMYVPAMLIVVSLMSLLLDTVQGRWNLPLRLSYIVPASMTGATAVLIWYFMLEPSLSPYQDALHALGITQGNQIWRQGGLAWIFVAMAFFVGAGNWIVVQYGSLQSIPDDILEAARIDGANAWQISWRIKLPLIRKYLVYMGILVFAAGLQVFVEPQLISGSVYTGIAKDWSLNQLSYDLAFQSNNLADSAALSLMLLVVCIVAAIVVIFRTDFFEGTGVGKK
jgi:multiple sugar transport system permease protein